MTMQIRRVVQDLALAALLVALCVVAASAGLRASPAEGLANDYCGRYLAIGEQCYEGSGYRAWRYHQGSTNGVVVPGLCVQSWTGSNYRSGSLCSSNDTFYSFCNFYDQPSANSSVNWGGSAGGPVQMFGHADNSSSHPGADYNNGC